MKKKKVAAAIGYKTGDFAPLLLASGKGREAEQIISIAEKEGIAVVENEAFAEMLSAGTPGEFVPPWCWETAAKILAFVIKADGSVHRH